MSVETAYARMEGLIEVYRPIDVPPIAVRLADRAVALAAIMEYLNKASMTKGSKIQLENGGGQFSRRYEGRANDVQRGAEKNTAELRDGFDQGIRMLAATEAMEAHGHDEDEVELARIRMQAEINKQFGVGKADVGTRAVVVERAQQYSRSE